MVKWHPTQDVLFSCSYDNTIKARSGGGLGGLKFQLVQVQSSNKKGQLDTKVVVSDIVFLHVCPRYLGEMIQFDYKHLFQMGWKNHQL